MPTTPAGDFAGPHRRHRCRHASSTTPARTIHRRHRTPPHTPTRRAGFSPRPTALWPFADADPLPGTTQLAGWLGRVIVTLVTGYTRPGDRVLLLTPPAPPHRQPTFRGTRGTDPYTGLAEAVWTVIRLGRGADIATPSPSPGYSSTPADTTHRQMIESASGLRLQRSDPHTSAADHHTPDSRAVCVEERPGDRFDLIITAVHPHDTDWPAHTDWNTILTPTGTIAAVTHSDNYGSWLTDAMPAVVSTFRARGWQWHDHIAVLTEPLPTPTIATTTPASGAVPMTDSASLAAAEPLPIRLLHHDLLMFTTAPPGTQTRPAVPGEASDE